MFLRLVVVGTYAAGLALGASRCPQEPLSLPIKEVQVYPNVANSFIRGIPAKVGTPPQDIVMIPWPDLNNTWLYNQQVRCDKTIVWNDLICDIRRGRPFAENDSTSFRKTSDIVAAGGATVETSYQGAEKGIPKLVDTSLAGTDFFAPQGTEGFKDFPFGIPRLQWDQGYTFLHPLGLGSNSTYLDALYNAGKIGSRVFSMFWGRLWVDNPIDGSLILGGYDKEKTIGRNYTAPLDYGSFAGSSGCWTGMKVQISDIQISKRDGSDESILPSSIEIPACIVPHRHSLMEVPQAVMDRFETLTDTKSNGTSNGLNWNAKVYSPDNVFDGDITIVLGSGLKIRVPNSQFVTPHLDMDRNGTRFFDDTKRDVVINGLDKEPPTLGRYFLTSAYLMVNHDAKTFTLWQANPTVSTNLVPVSNEDTAKRCKDGKAIVPPSVSSAADSSSKPSGGVIGGAVAGGVIGATLLGLAAFLLIRSRRKGVAGGLKGGSSSTADSKLVPSTYAAVGQSSPEYAPQEMTGSSIAPHELYDGHRQVYEMDSGGFGYRGS